MFFWSKPCFDFWRRFAATALMLAVCFDCAEPWLTIFIEWKSLLLFCDDTGTMIERDFPIPVFNCRWFLSTGKRERTEYMPFFITWNARWVTNLSCYYYCCFAMSLTQISCCCCFWHCALRAAELLSVWWAVNLARHLRVMVDMSWESPCHCECPCNQSINHISPFLNCQSEGWDKLTSPSCRSKAHCRKRLMRTSARSWRDGHLRYTWAGHKS